MALDFQVSQYPFRSGLAEGIEPHQVNPGTLTTAENVVWKKSGRLEKRFGTTQLAATIIGGSSIGLCKRLLTRGSELCLLDGTSLYSYSASAASWKNAGKVPEVGATWKPLASPMGGVYSSDSFVSGDYLVTAWVLGDPTYEGTTGGALWMQVTSVASGTVYMPPTQIAAGPLYGVRVIVIGTDVTLFAAGNASANLTIYQVTLTTFSYVGLASLRTDRVATNVQNWDAAPITGTSEFMIAYGNATGLRLERFDAAYTTVANATLATAGAISRVSISATDGESVYVGYHDVAAAEFRLMVADPATMVQVGTELTLLGTADPISIGVCRYDATQCVVAYTDLTGTGRLLYSSRVTDASALVANTTRKTPGTSLVGTPFVLGSRHYAVVSNYPVLGATAFLFTGNTLALLEMDTTAVTGGAVTHPFVANLDNLIGGANGYDAPLPNAQALSATAVVFAAPVIDSPPTLASGWRTALRRVELAIGTSLPVDMWRPVGDALETYMAGGVLSSYDGASVFDYGFARAPNMLGVAATTPGGSMAAGNYLYGTNLEYRGAAGRVYRSGVGTIVDPVTTGVTAYCTIQSNEFHVGNKSKLGTERYSTQTVLYRSTVGGTSLHRLTVDPFTSNPVPYTAEYFSIVDDQGDSLISHASTLSARPLVYTAGGILEDYQPPSCVTMCLHADRLWVLAGDELTWWYSKAFQDDTGVAPGFSPQFRIVFSEPQVAMASMDDKAVFFSESGVKYMLGVGPAPNGQNSDFQNPTTIQSDVGCTSARSVVTTPDGVMFLSARGLYLLSRGMELVWIGRPVRDTLASYPVVTSATLVAKHNQVRFTCTDAAATVGVTIVYDYVEKQWSTYKHWVEGVYGGPIADACMWNGAWTFASATGLVYTESASSYLDAGSLYVPMTIETAWISGPPNAMSASSGPLKFQSVRQFGINGTSHTDHDLSVSIGFDSETTYAQVATFLAETPTTVVGDLEECTVTIGTRRKCGSIRFKVQDATPTTGTVGTGRGPSFDMMALEVGNKRGLVAAPATKRA